MIEFILNYATTPHMEKYEKNITNIQGMETRFSAGDSGTCTDKKLGYWHGCHNAT